MRNHGEDRYRRTMVLHGKGSTSGRVYKIGTVCEYKKIMSRLLFINAEADESNEEACGKINLNNRQHR